MKISAKDIVAFAAAEGLTQLPYDVLIEMSPTDPLYISLVKAWEKKQEREDRRVALICATLCNVMGSGKKKIKVEDFLPKKPKSIAEQESELKANLMAYNKRVEMIQNLN